MTPGDSALGPKAARTRAAILAAAEDRFERFGYDRTTVRAVAGDVGIDPSMVMRYFGSKQKLFLAASRLELQLTLFADVPIDRLGSTMAAHFLDVWDGDDTGRPLRILLGTALSDPDSAEQMRGIFHQQLTPAVAQVREDADVCAGLIAAQVLGFALCRYIIGIPAVRDLERSQAVDWLGQSIQRHLEHG